MRLPSPALLALLLVACRADKGAGETGTPAPAPAVRAIVDPDRPEHFFDAPFPDDARLDAEGRPDLTGFPAAATELGGDILGGWAGRLEQTAHGFANHGAVYFRFTGTPPFLDADTGRTTGAADDPIVLVDAGTGERLPLEYRFVADPGGDPFYAENTLAVAVALGHPPRSGATLVAAVMAEDGLGPPAGWVPTDAEREALRVAGVSGAPAVATTFTVQDATGQLRAVRDDILARLGEAPDWGTPVLRRVAALAYAQGATPSGKDSTVCTVTFEDGSTELRYLAALSPTTPSHAYDLLDDWPLAVFQVEIPVLNYSRLADRPYMRPGFGHVADIERETGWWEFAGGAPGTPDVEVISLTVQLPKDADGGIRDDAPVVIWDHGTGGHAYNAVQRRSPYDDGRSLAEAFGRHGWALVSRDSPLYGTRYPLIDEGYGASLGFYNIVNLPAFRDNQRQAAVEGIQIRRFVESGLNGLLPDGSVDATRLRRAGHSLGSVTTNLGVAADPGVYEATFLSGSGGVLGLYFLDTGLIDGFDPSVLGSLFTLFGAEAPDEVTTEAALGAILGVPEEAWGHIDRLHPAMTLFQWTMDPSDPMSVARDVDLPSTMLIGVGDFQVPNHTSDALLEALPDAGGTRCAANGDYDPHWVLHRESCAVDLLDAWLAE